MTQNKVFYDNKNMVVFLNGIKVEKSYFKVKNNDIISIISKLTGGIYNLVKNPSNTSSKNIKIFDVGNGFNYMILQEDFKRLPVKTVFSKNMNGNYVHIEYDGLTHFTIEDNDYIFKREIPNYRDINVKVDDNIYLIRYQIEQINYLLIIRKVQDYEILLDVSGTNIEVISDAIIVENKYNDSLNRSKTERYEVKEDKYVLTDKSFKYDAMANYRDLLKTQLIEDAIYADDIDYIAKMMTGDVDKDILSHFFDSILGDKFNILSIEPLTRDTMYFLVDNGIEQNLEKIKIEFDSSGKIENFDREE